MRLDMSGQADRIPEWNGYFQKWSNSVSSQEEVLQRLGLLALQIQNSAGYEVHHLEVLPCMEADVFRVFVEYQSEDAGLLACESALRMLQEHSIDFEPCISELKQIKSSEPPVLSLSEALNPNKKPIIAITGTNGKTTTTRLIAHICNKAGIRTGFTTSDGIYIQGSLVEKGDTTGPASARKILEHPEVDLAVLETARGGILRAGLAFHSCDIAVVTNVQADHLGLGDIHTTEEMARVKRLIVDVLKTQGLAVLNANNVYTSEMNLRKDIQYGWFALDKSSLLDKSGSFLAYRDGDVLKLEKEDRNADTISLQLVPLSFGGRVPFMIENCLAAMIACAAYGISWEHICEGLQSFRSSAEQTPGRLNEFQFKQFTVMVDFAHNPDGFAGVREFLKHIHSTYKIGIITGTGDRPEESTIALGSISAEMFDHIIIHQAKFHRGKDPQEIVRLLIEGIRATNPEASYEYIQDDIEPLSYAIRKSKPGSYITALSDVLNQPLDMIPRYQNDPELNYD